MTNRLGGATQTLTLNAGTFNLQGNTTTAGASSEALGTLTLASGQSVINVGFASAYTAPAAPTFSAPGVAVTASLTAATLARNTGATVNFTGGGAGNLTPLGVNTGGALAQVILSNLSAAPAATTALQFVGNTSTGTNNGNILPYAEYNGASGVGNFTTYSATGITQFTNYIVVAAGGNITLTNVPGDIVEINATAAGVINGPANAIGALLIQGNGNAITYAPNFNSAGTITSGALMTTGTAVVTLGNGALVNPTLNTVNPVFNLGTETDLFQNNSGGTTFTDGYLAGTGGLTIAGANTLTMSSNADVNAIQTMTFTTVTTIAGTFTITYNGQTTQPIIYSATTATLQANIEQALFALSNVGPLGPNSIAVSNAASPVFTFQNALGGTFIPLLQVNTAGLAGTGTVVVTNTQIGGQVNTYSGPTAFNAGTVVLPANTAPFGTGAVTFTGGNVTTSIALSLGNSVTINGPVTFTNNSGNASVELALIGPVTLGANNAFIDNTNPLLVTGVVGGPANVPLTVLGNNALELVASNTYAGGTVLVGGYLGVDNNAALGSGALVFAGVSGNGDGSLQPLSDVTISNPVQIPNTFGNISSTGFGSFNNNNTSANNNVTFTNLQVLGVGDMNFQSQGNVFITGTLAQIPGASGGILTTSNSNNIGVLVLNPTTNTTAGLYESNGIVMLGSATALGSGPLVVNGGGGIAANVPLTIPNNV